MFGWFGPQRLLHLKLDNEDVDCEYVWDLGEVGRVPRFELDDHNDRIWLCVTFGFHVTITALLENTE